MYVTLFCSNWGAWIMCNTMFCWMGGGGGGSRVYNTLFCWSWRVCNCKCWTVSDKEGQQFKVNLCKTLFCWSWDGTVVQIPCPLCIVPYNKYMGGVDKGDLFSSVYRTCNSGVCQCGQHLYVFCVLPYSGNQALVLPEHITSPLQLLSIVKDTDIPSYRHKQCHRRIYLPHANHGSTLIVRQPTSTPWILSWSAFWACIASWRSNLWMPRLRWAGMVAGELLHNLHFKLCKIAMVTNTLSILNMLTFLFTSCDQ